MLCDICRSSLDGWNANDAESSSHEADEAVQGRNNGDVGPGPKSRSELFGSHLVPAVIST